MSLWAEFSHTLQWQGNMQEGEASVKIHCLEPPSRRERKWTHHSFFSHLYLLPQHIPTSPLPPLSHSFTPGIKLIIQKVTCGLCLSPLPSISLQQWGEKKERKMPEGVSILITRSSWLWESHKHPLLLIVIFSHITSSFSELTFFIHKGEKVPRIGKL